MYYNKHPRTVRKRISYWFDNRMAQGFGAKIRLLFFVTFIFVILVGFLSAVTHGGVREHFGEDFIRIIMYSLGKGNALSPDDAHISTGYFFLMLLTIVYCIFFAAMLIGLINNALQAKVEDLGKGQGHVIENNHTLILGYNDATFALLNEIIEANMNHAKTQTVVILGDTDQKIMIEQIQKRIGWPKRTSKTRIVCRTGSIYYFDDLKRCSIEDCRSVIINAGTDFEAIKAIMACSHILNETFIDIEKAPFLVSIVQSDESLIEARLAAYGQSRKKLIVLALNEILARIIVHTSRQPGLSDIFTELFNFAGSELYILPDDPGYSMLYGKTIADINQSLKDAFAIGVRKNNDRIIIDAPFSVTFEEGDSLIVVKDDDDPLKINAHPVEPLHMPLIPVQSMGIINVLILGVEPVLDNILAEYSNYLPAGSSIRIVDNKSRFHFVVSDTTRAKLLNKSIFISITACDINQKKEMNKLLHEYTPDCVLILIDEEASGAAAEDERVMRVLIYLREYRNRVGKNFSITCEMLLSQNKDLAAATEPDDFIISRQFTALMLSQISYNENMAPLFKTLLSSNGFEIYMKPAFWYLPLNTPVDLNSVGLIVAKRGETFIGISQNNSKHNKHTVLNPMKYDLDNKPEKYIFHEDDYFVVLAESNRFPEYPSISADTI